MTKDDLQIITSTISHAESPTHPWQHSEKFWIAYGRKQGWPLTNGTNGGDGVDGITGDGLARMRATWLGRKHKPESIERIAAASKGRTKSESSKALMRQIMTGREITWGDKLSQSLQKFTTDQTTAIQARLKNGETVISLSKEFGVHRTTMSKIKNGTYHNQRAH